MTIKKLLSNVCLLLAPAVLFGQGRGVEPEELLKPLKDSWPTYNGDYSGKRYSALTQINQQTVKNLTLAWYLKITPGSVATGGGGGGRGGGGGGGGAQGGLIVGGEGTGEFNGGGGNTIK